ATGWPLHLLHAAAPEPDFVGYDEAGGPYDEERRANELTDELRDLNAMAKAIGEDGIQTEAQVVVGPTVEVILQKAAETDAAVVAIVGHKHNAMHRLVQGSVAAALLKAANVPVLVLPTQEDDDSAESAEESGHRLRHALEHFETEHPNLTKVLNDISYYLSGSGL
ncbi:MAG: DUF4404 family protein, partial [Acidimicrobiales bacterium]|nr:DUF4404 family protein [Acidimicrobiales bacterium]